VVEGRAAYVDDRGPIVSGVVTRSPAMVLGHDLLRQAFEREFRTTAGAAYAPWSTYEPVDADHAVVMAGSDLGAELMSVVVARTTQVVRTLRAQVPSPAQVQQLVAARVQALEDPYALMSLAVASASQLLAGAPTRTREEWVEEARTVTPEQVRRGMEEVHATLLIGVPGGSTWADELPVLEPRHRGTVRGRAHRSRNWPADPTRLQVGDGGLRIRDRGSVRTVPLDSVAAVLTFDDGLRQVVQHDGYTLALDPRAWHGGTRAVAELDRVVPDDLHLPQPALDLPEPVRAGFVRRWTWPLTHRDFATSTFLVILAALVLVGIVGYGAARGLASGGTVGLTAGLCGFLLVSWFRRG
jgi:hypothetical protein